MWKIVWKRIPHYLNSKLEIDDDTKISTKNPRLQITAKNFRWTTTTNWNLLPENLRTQKQLSRFKTGIKKWIRERRITEPEPDPDVESDTEPDT